MHIYLLRSGCWIDNCETQQQQQQQQRQYQQQQQQPLSRQTNSSFHSWGGVMKNILGFIETFELGHSLPPPKPGFMRKTKQRQ